MGTIRRRTALLVTACLTAVLVACGGGPQYVPVDIRDTSATVVSVRAEWHLRTQTTGTFGEIKDGVEVQYLQMSGKDDQTLAAGQNLSIGGQSVVGPQQVSHSADISYAHLAYGGTARLPDYPLEMDVFMGAGRVEYTLRSSTTASAPLTLRTEEVDYALTMGLGLRWRFIEKAAIEGRIIILTQNPFSFFAGTFGDGDQTDMIESELALVFRPIKQVAVRGGYAWMSLTPEKSSGSPLDFSLGGPFLGIGISF